MLDSIRADRRLQVGLTAMVCLCAAFWAGSRYPSLQGKADAGALSALETPLGFERQLEGGSAPQAFYERVTSTALEWLLTNLEGMTFGLLAAALALTMLPIMTVGFSGRYRGVLEGALLGTPLGVCANCAAPIGASMMGRSPSAGLSIIVSSPSFNVILLGMLLTQFAWYFVVIKLLSVFLLLAAIPRLAGRGFGALPLRPVAGQKLFTVHKDAGGASGVNVDNTLASALVWFSTRFAKNCFVVALRFVPLMVLAGFLGAGLIELFPWGGFGPELNSLSFTTKIALLCLVSVFGAFLPVPIAFDIVICAALVAAGTPDFVVGALLVTLGVFSVYPWMLTGARLSWKTANLLMAGVIFLGGLGGVAAHTLGLWHEQQQQRQLFEILAASDMSTESGALGGAPPAALPASAEFLECASAIDVSDKVALRHCGGKLPVKPSGNLKFQLRGGASLGLAIAPFDPDAYGVLSAGHFGGLATSDINQDGWPDIAVAGEGGVSVFMNRGGTFERVSVFDQRGQAPAGTAALIDLTNDGFPELVVGTYGAGVKVYVNTDGGFDRSQPAHILADYRGYIHALAFSDFDDNGKLDIAVGTAWGTNRISPDIPNQNYLAYNQGSHFDVVKLSGSGGETLSLLSHDLNGDGLPDLLAGNDFAWPDVALLNSEGVLKSAPASSAHVRADSSRTTMSLVVTPGEGDLESKLYSAQIAFGRMNSRFAGGSELVDVIADCGVFESAAVRDRCTRQLRIATATSAARRLKNFEKCNVLGDDAFWCALRSWDQILSPQCKLIPDNVAHFARRHCDLLSTYGDSDASYSQFLAENSPIQINNVNSLYRYSPDGVERVEGAEGAEIGGWSWNSQFIDLDADGLQDILVASGAWLDPSSWSGWRYYRGTSSGFRLDSEPLKGLDLPVSSWVALDYDRDGDMDIVALPSLLSPVVYENIETRGRKVSISLQLSCGVASAVGAKVSARIQGEYVGRFVNASGGYASHNGQSVHFGLGEAPHIEALEVLLPGEKPIVIEEAISPGHTYITINNCDNEALVKRALPNPEGKG